jgi:hypothetical protein
VLIVVDAVLAPGPLGVRVTGPTDGPSALKKKVTLPTGELVPVAAVTVACTVTVWLKVEGSGLTWVMAVVVATVAMVRPLSKAPQVEVGARSTVRGLKPCDRVSPAGGALKTN